MRNLLTTAAGVVAVAFAPLPAAAQAAGAAPSETTKRIFERAIPNVPGKVLIALEVDYPPGGASPSHTHAKSAFIYAYVVSGQMESAVNGETPRVYTAGESWYEAPGSAHTVSRNASQTEPAKLLAIFVADPDQKQLTFPAKE